MDRARTIARMAFSLVWPSPSSPRYYTPLWYLGRKAAESCRVTWALRRAAASAATSGSAAGQLPERGALGLRAGQAVDAGTVTPVTGFRTEQVRTDDAGRAVLVAEDGRELPPADTAVVLTGFRPDLSFLSEIRLDLDPVLVLPDTGVCGGAGLFDDPDGASGGSCCAPAPQVLQIGLASSRG
jgi:hypothetical protein